MHKQPHHQRQLQDRQTLPAGILSGGGQSVPANLNMRLSANTDKICLRRLSGFVCNFSQVCLQFCPALSAIRTAFVCNFGGPGLGKVQGTKKGRNCADKLCLQNADKRCTILQTKFVCKLQTNFCRQTLSRQPPPKKKCRRRFVIIADDRVFK